jgi:hypothetical protein
MALRKARHYSPQLSVDPPELRPEKSEFTPDTGFINLGEARTMTTSIREITAWQVNGRGTWWSQHREASLNWLALGLLLAAWNASDNDRAQSRRRPEALRGYSSVSVRAATLHCADLSGLGSHFYYYTRCSAPKFLFCK